MELVDCSVTVYVGLCDRGRCPAVAGDVLCLHDEITEIHAPIVVSITGNETRVDGGSLS